jgi:hypothetical protein
MAITPVTPIDKVLRQMYLLPPVMPVADKKQKPEPGFKEALAKKKKAFQQGKIPYQKILKGKDGWVYRM